MKILLVDFYKLKSKMLSEIVPISDFWFPKSDWPQSILIVDFNLTPVLHKSRVRKSNVRLGSIDFFFPVRWVRCRSIVELGPWFEFEWVRLGSIYYAGSMICKYFLCKFQQCEDYSEQPKPYFESLTFAWQRCLLQREYFDFVCLHFHSLRYRRS